MSNNNLSCCLLLLWMSWNLPNLLKQFKIYWKNSPKPLPTKPPIKPQNSSPGSADFCLRNFAINRSFHSVHPESSFFPFSCHTIDGAVSFRVLFFAHSVIIDCWGEIGFCVVLVLKGRIVICGCSWEWKRGKSVVGGVWERIDCGRVWERFG